MLAGELIRNVYRKVTGEYDETSGLMTLMVLPYSRL
jgi:hypothetical protein